MEPRAARSSSVIHVKPVAFPPCNFETDLDKNTYDDLLGVWHDIRHTLTVVEQTTFCSLVSLLGRPRSSSRCNHHPINKLARGAEPFDQAYYHVLKAMFGIEACMKQPWWSTFKESYPQLAERDEAESSDSESDDSTVNETELNTSLPETTFPDTTIQDTALSEITVQDATLPDPRMQEETLQETLQDDLLQNATQEDITMDEASILVEDDFEEDQIDDDLPQEQGGPHEDNPQQEIQTNSRGAQPTLTDEEAILSAILSNTPQQTQESNHQDANTPEDTTSPAKRPATSPPASILPKRRRESLSATAPTGSKFRAAPGTPFLVQKHRQPPESTNPQLQARIRALEQENREIEQRRQMSEENVQRLKRREHDLQKRVEELEGKVSSVREANSAYGKILRQINKMS